MRWKLRLQETYVQNIKQVLLNKYFIFEWGICYFNITSYLIKLCVFGERSSIRRLRGAYQKELASYYWTYLFRDIEVTE